MQELRTNKSWVRTQYDLIVMVAIVFLFTVFSISVGLSSKIYDLLSTYASMPEINFVFTEILILMLGAIWIAYRRWRMAQMKYRELDAIIDSISPDVLLVVSPSRKIVMANSSIKRLYGYDVAEILGKTTDMLYYDRRKEPMHYHELYEIIRNDGFHIGEARGIKKNGETMPLEIITGNIRNREGAVLLLRDITERKLVEQELTQLVQDLEIAVDRLKVSNNNLKNVLSRVFEGIVLVDNVGYVRLINPNAEVFLAANSEQMLDRPFKYKISPGEILTIPITRTNGQKGLGQLLATQTEWEGNDARVIYIRDITDLDEEETGREQLFRDFETLLDKKHEDDLLHELAVLGNTDEQS